ncbi:MAG: MATE family efflux transporter [Lachnospiraceae bacterium]|nr:MATE family efflux transporter [Lachnospiraceae bacterium]
MESNTTVKKANPLGYAPIGSLIAKFAIPSVISFLVTSAYNITDQIFIGHVIGMLGNAATNVSFPLVTLTTALAQLAGVGTAANFNLRMGAKEEEKAKEYIGTGIALMAIIGTLLFLIVTIFKSPLLILCGATDTVFPLAKSYLGITAIGLPFLLFTNSSSNVIRADGSPSYSMFCTVTGAVLNIFLDWLFMFVFEWGIQGAAIATVIGQIVSFLLCISYYFRFKTFKIRFSMLVPQINNLIDIIKVGMSNFFNLFIMMFVNIVLNNSLKTYGAQSIYGSDIPLAVSGVIAKINSILSAFSVGISHGCQPIFGFNMGAKNYGRVKETYKKAITVALCLSLVALFSFQMFPRQITGIFGSGNELYFQFAEQYLRIFLLMVSAQVINPITVNYFTSTGNVKQGIFLSLSRQGLILLPLLLILPKFLGIDGILYAGPIADLAAGILSLAMVAVSFKKMTKLENEA